MTKYRLLIHSARQVVQIVQNGERILTGKRMKSVEVLQQVDGGEGFSVLVDV